MFTILPVSGLVEYYLKFIGEEMETWRHLAAEVKQLKKDRTGRKPKESVLRASPLNQFGMSLVLSSQPSKMHAWQLRSLNL